ncbi:MAG: hypothetical protein ACRERS_06590, partial [Methylococcales bacterium]
MASIEKKVFMANYGYLRVSRKRVCRICGKPDWCSYTPEERISFCARVTFAADRISRTGWGVFYHDPFQLPKAPWFHFRTSLRSPALEIAPIEIRDFVYQQLIDLASASLSPEIVYGPKGLNERRIRNIDGYGSLPRLKVDRNKLAGRLAESLDRKFPGFRGNKKSFGSRIPGFWTDSNGRPKLWHDHDYPNPIMVIPYRDLNGLIQACQIRLMAPAEEEKRTRYMWLSAPKNAGGISCGTHLHFARFDPNLYERPILITEGALKAETFCEFQDSVDVIASSGVSCSHDKIISVTRFRPMLIGFDRDTVD